MNVLFLGADGRTGGVRQYIKNIINNTNYNKYNINYFIANLTPDEVKAEYNKNTKFIQFDLKYSLFNLILKVWELKKIVDDNNIEIIHAHPQRSGFLASICNKLYGIKVVYTPHGFRHSQLKGIKFYLHRSIEKFILNNINYLTLMTEKEISILEDLNINDLNYRKIKTRIASVQSKIKQKLENRNIVMIGSLKPKKEPKLFIDIASNFLNENIIFTWIGDGELKKNMEKYTENNNINNVEFIGQIPNNESIDLLANSDILLFTSSLETFPLTILEAFMTEVCVISNSFKGVEELVIDGKTGLVFKNNNVQESVVLIKKLLDDEKLSNSIKHEAKIFFEKNHSGLDKFSDDFCNIYKSL